MECISCSAGLDHCHGTLVLHTDDVVECTEPGCRDYDRIRHTLTLTCDEIPGGCHCTADLVVEEYAHAS